MDDNALLATLSNSSDAKASEIIFTELQKVPQFLL